MHALHFIEDRITTNSTKTKLPTTVLNQTFLTTQSHTMENEKGELVDLYVPLSKTPLSLPSLPFPPLPSLLPNASQVIHPTNFAPSSKKNSYVPRKCSATNRIIKAKDHASVQISVGKVDENGRYTGENQVYALCGFVRAMGEGDDSLNRLAQRDGMLKGVWSGQKMR